ncbi:MAG TPA: bifunctional 4-hydroxy-2-oxoglutarate aldolase/2-dehydro-3-deoxy-phosphogluconate aldolase, partial [Trueperaceae bacterium]|nr:bifunctional 4-hydroxy-2-oxoglutarate aldolase/2-dehydro-3-deoxy-phosphogluconate aldolase [Trueperaceae bacterium]
LDAGAGFTVAPNLDRQSVELALSRDRLHLPGVFTGSEIAAAMRLGARMLKLFPCDAHGPALVRAMRAPFDDVDLVAVGGVNAANLSDFFASGAVAVGLGSSVTKLVGDVSALRREAAAIRAGIDTARGALPPAARS